MQIILGEENRRTVLIVNGTVQASNDTFEVLACDAYRAFWLTWDSQTYQVCEFVSAIIVKSNLPGICIKVLKGEISKKKPFPHI